MGNVTVRFFDKGNKPNYIELPTTKKELSECMYGNSFEEKDFDIYHISVLGVEFDNLANDKDMKGFNLLAEKIEMLDKEQVLLFQAVLNSKSSFIAEKLKVVDSLELCKILDNLDCYRLHTGGESLKDSQLINCERIEYLGVLERVGEYKNIDNSGIYSKYEMPEDSTLFRLEIEEFKDFNEGGESYSLSFPLREIVKNDFEIVKNIDENKHFKIISNYYYDLDLYMDYLVTKQDLLELNDFTNKFIKLDTDTQNKFNAVYNMYIEVYKDEFEKGVPINRLNQVMKDIDKFEFFNHREMKELIINGYLTEKGVERELRN